MGKKCCITTQLLWSEVGLQGILILISTSSPWNCNKTCRKNLFAFFFLKVNLNTTFNNHAKFQNLQVFIFMWKRINWISFAPIDKFTPTTFSNYFFITFIFNPSYVASEKEIVSQGAISFSNSIPWEHQYYIP